MVASLVSLKFTLLRNALSGSAWRIVGLVFAILYAAGAVALATLGLVFLRTRSSEVAGPVTTVGFAMLTLGWMALSVLVFGSDETLDPRRFALLPLRARQLIPGLLAAGLASVGGIATTVIALGYIVSWTRSPGEAATALVAALLGVVTCFLLARVTTTALAAMLATRRFRDLGAVIVALMAFGFAIAANSVGLIGTNVDQALAWLAKAAQVAGWTPFGWAWSAPASAANGAWTTVGVKLGLAAALVAVLLLAWERFLDRQLCSPLETGGGGGTVSTSTLIERLTGASVAGAVAARSLRVWRRDPRYTGMFVMMLLMPILITLPTLAATHGEDGAPRHLAYLGPIALSWMAGQTLVNDLAYDGSALWAHIASGIRGVDDRWGRVLAMIIVTLPVVVVAVAGVGWYVGDLAHIPLLVALTAAGYLGALGAGAWIGAIFQGTAPPPGASPFQGNSVGGMQGMVGFVLSTLLTVAVVLPTIAALVVSIWVPWVVWLAIIIAVVSGAAAVIAGCRLGGSHLDRHWPEVFANVTKAR